MSDHFGVTDQVGWPQVDVRVEFVYLVSQRSIPIPITITGAATRNDVMGHAMGYLLR